MKLDKCLHSLMDRTTVSGTVGAGSIPAGGANYKKVAFYPTQRIKSVA